MTTEAYQERNTQPVGDGLVPSRLGGSLGAGDHKGLAGDQKGLAGDQKGLAGDHKGRPYGVWRGSATVKVRTPA